MKRCIRRESELPWYSWVVLGLAFVALVFKAIVTHDLFIVFMTALIYSGIGFIIWFSYSQKTNK